MYALTMLNGFDSLCFMPKYPLIITDKEKEEYYNNLVDKRLKIWS